MGVGEGCGLMGVCMYVVDVGEEVFGMWSRYARKSCKLDALVWFVVREGNTVG